MPAFALTMFLGAFLLFQVQPLIGRFILPWFGGASGVWTTCLLFFQAVLLGGYAYAHCSARCLKPRTQVVVHGFLLAAALALLPITPGDRWKPGGGGHPTLQILLLLTACLGLPYFVLSATAPLLQRWFSLVKPGVSPYRLYALSNLGSLLALLSYPLVFELYFTRRMQAAIWAVGLIAFAVCLVGCARKLWELNPAPNATEPPVSSGEIPMRNAQPSVLNRILWLLLPACASVLLLATTNKLCQDVAVVPFLWVLPLALYLLSFILCFDHPRWYARRPFTLALVAAMGAIGWVLPQGADARLATQLSVYGAGLFVCCMVCHGELYRLKPEARYLTSFYLHVAAGGALGGALVAVAAPLLFTDYFELHWGLVLCGALFLVAALRDRDADGGRSWRWVAWVLTLAVFGGLDQGLAWVGRKYPAIPKVNFVVLRVGVWSILVFLMAAWLVSGRHKRFTRWRLLAGLWLTLGLGGLGAVLHWQAQDSQRKNIHALRNFYGVLAVREYNRDDPTNHYFILRHGRITHGLQFANPPRSVQPTSYYGEQSGVGLAMAILPERPRRIGMVGLGTGTLAAYGRVGDTFRIYELNPDVPGLATNYFRYLNQCRGKVEIVRGDARLSMEREPSQHFDLLVLDAFSSDAIPVHLLTREAFEIYRRHLAEDGIIAVHISNHFLDLEPVVLNLAGHFGYGSVGIDYDSNDADWWLYNSTWILLTQRPGRFSSPAIQAAANPARTNRTELPLWTDDFLSVVRILK